MSGYLSNNFYKRPQGLINLDQHSFPEPSELQAKSTARRIAVRCEFTILTGWFDLVWLGLAWFCTED